MWILLRSILSFKSFFLISNHRAVAWCTRDKTRGKQIIFFTKTEKFEKNPKNIFMTFFGKTEIAKFANSCPQIKSPSPYFFWHLTSTTYCSRLFSILSIIITRYRNILILQRSSTDLNLLTSS